MPTDTLAAQEYVFTALDRCDRCSGQAYHRVTKGAAELFLCAHHGREHNDTLWAKGWTVFTDDKALKRLADPV